MSLNNKTHSTRTKVERIRITEPRTVMAWGKIVAMLKIGQ